MEPSPINSNNVNSQPQAASVAAPKSANTIPIIFGVLLLLVTTAIAVSGWQMNKKLSNDVSDLQSQLNTVKEARTKPDNLISDVGIDESKFQAVFLADGTVYFGKVTYVTESEITIKNIYYLRTDGQTQPTYSSTSEMSDIALVKLGCELHGPSDEMIINRDKVNFWENLKDDAQVVKAIAEYERQNPNGQACIN